MANPAWVQQTSNNGNGVSSLTTTAFTGNTTSGNCIVVYVFGLNSTKLTGVTDSTSANTYNSLASSFHSTSQFVVAYAAQNITGGSGVTVKVTASASTITGIVAIEVSNLLASGTLLDQSGATNGISNPSPSVTTTLSSSTTNTNDLLIYGAYIQDSVTKSFSAGSLGGSTGQNLIQENVPTSGGNWATMTQAVSSLSAFSGTFSYLDGGNGYATLLVALSNGSGGAITNSNFFQFM